MFFFVFYNCKNIYKELTKELVEKFRIKDLGQLKQCLGMCVNVCKDSISIDQKQYIDTLLKKYNMLDCSHSEIPMEFNLKLEKDISTDTYKKFPYQQFVESLMYLSVLTRPDICYSIRFLSQFNNCFN